MRRPRTPVSITSIVTSILAAVLLAVPLAGSQPAALAAAHPPGQGPPPPEQGGPPPPLPPKTLVEAQATGPGSITQTDFTDHGQPNFDLVALQGHDLVHYWRSNGDVLQPWHRGEVITDHATGPGAIIQSDFGREFRGGHGNLEVVVPEGDHLTEYFKNSNLDGPWQQVTTFGSGVTGAPSFIQSDMGREFGQHGNFEVVVPQGQTIAHYYRINGPTPGAWQGGPTNITGADSSASLIQSDYTYQGHGNLELLVRQGDQVAHWYHVYGEPENAWHQGQVFAHGVTGTPALMQSNFGRENPGQHGNLEALIPEGTNLQQWYRPDGQEWQTANRPPGNQDPSTSMVPGGPFYSPASFIQSSLGDRHNNFEMVALVDLNLKEPQDHFPADAMPGPGAGGPEFMLKQFYQDNSGDDPSRPWKQAQEITYRDRSDKVCQVTGQQDRETGRPTAASGSAQHADVYGTDLGYPVDDGTTLRLFFGDTWDGPAHNAASSEDGQDDTILDTNSTAAPSPENCLQGARWEQQPPGGFKTPRVSPPIPQGLFNVPSSGFTVGADRYLIFWTDHCSFGACPHQGDFHGHREAYDGSGKAVVTRYNPATDQYDQVFPPSGDSTSNPMPGHFGYTASVNADSLTNQGLPADQAGYIYVWSNAIINPDNPNAGTYRNADPVLLRIPANQGAIANRATWQYFAGWDPGGAPRWSSDSADERDLFPHGVPQPPNGADYCTGESSVNWIAQLHKWLMLYNCAPHGGETIKTGIVARVAPAPWGPWSAPSQVFDGVDDNAYCRYMHNPPNGPGAWCHDNLDEAGNQTGAEYAPYVLPRYTTANPDGSASIYYMMSTWNPYQAVVMHMNLTSP